MSTTVADLIPSGEPPAPVGVMAVTPDPTPEPSGTAPRRGVGRPKGSKTRRPNSARKTAAAGATRAAEAALTDKEPKPGRPTVQALKSATMEEGLRNFYIGAGAMLEVAGAVIVKNRRVAAVGEAFGQNADLCAKALVAWSEQNAAVRRALEQLTTAGGAALVLSAHAPIIMAAIDPPAPGESGGGGLADILAMFDSPGTDDAP